MKLRLTIEPRPVSTWGVTLSNRLPKKEWDNLRTKVYRKADYKCEICGSNNSALHCHELWKFDEKKLIQRLVGLQCLCRLCHDVKHYGRSNEVYRKKYVEELTAHWCKVNKRTKRDFQVYLQEIFEMNRKRADKFYVVKVGRKILV